MDNFDRKLFEMAEKEPIRTPKDFRWRLVRAIAEARDREAERAARRRGARPVRMALAAVVAVALLTGTALAAYGFRDFFAGVFGPKGQEDTDSTRGEFAQGTDIVPGQSFETPDPEAIGGQLGPYVAEVGQSVTLGDYTLTVEDFMVDVNGAGAVTYRVENPKGLPEIETRSFPAGAWSCLSFSVRLETGSGAALNTVGIVDLDSLTETSLRAVEYFMPLERTELAEGETLRMGLTVRDDSGKALHAEKPVEMTVGARVPAVTLECRGLTARVTPLSLTVTAPEDSEDFWYDALDGDHRAVLRYKDGDEYQVVNWREDGAEQNYVTFGVQASTGRIAGIFNRYVDVGEVECLRIQAGEDVWEFTAE